MVYKPDVSIGTIRNPSFFQGLDAKGISQELSPRTMFGAELAPHNWLWTCLDEDLCPKRPKTNLQSHWSHIFGGRLSTAPRRPPAPGKPSPSPPEPSVGAGTVQCRPDEATGRENGSGPGGVDPTGRDAAHEIVSNRRHNRWISIFLHTPLKVQVPVTRRGA